MNCKRSKKARCKMKKSDIKKDTLTDLLEVGDSCRGRRIGAISSSRRCVRETPLSTTSFVLRIPIQLSVSS